MSCRFKDIPSDLDTRILFQQELPLGDYPVLYQKWSWDGLIAESIIFESDTVESFDDSKLCEIVSLAYPVRTNITVTRSKSGFTFVNFNFETE